MARSTLVSLGMAALCMGFVSMPQVSLADVITSIDCPEPVFTEKCHPAWDQVWHVPFQGGEMDIGIGKIVNTDPLGHVDVDLGLFDRAILTGDQWVVYEFDEAVVVEKLKVIQHSLGATKIEGFAGDTLGALVSLGQVAIIGPFSDKQVTYFDFGNTDVSGKYFKLVVRGSVRRNEFGFYRAFPLDTEGDPFPVVPEPACVTVLALGSLGLLLRRRK